MKPKFNINRKKLSDSEIDDCQDYDKLMQQYNKMVKPFYQTKWFWGAAGAAAVVIAVMYLFMHLHHKKQMEIAQLAKDSIATASITERFINPPMKGIDVPFENYKINASKGGEINYKTGSKLIIPPKCFVDNLGNVITGEVEIRYREFHDVVDFFVSGIPMTYDSAGTKYTFESAGMMEIQGYLNNKPIAMAEGKSIDVKMHSNYEGTQYNLYYLDTAKKCWDYLGKDKVVSCELPVVSSNTNTASARMEVTTSLEKKCPAEEKLTALQEQPLPVQPAKPVKEKEENYRFNIDVNTKEFPELAIYKDVLFEINPKHKGFDPKLYNVQWEDALLKKLEGDNNYELTLVKGEKKEVFSVYPVFEGKQYDEAKKVYDKKYEEYSAALDARKAEEKRLKQEAENQKQEAIAKWEAQKKAWEEKQRAESEAMLAQGQLANTVTREFRINGFGIYNCDSPQMWPKGAALSPCVMTDNAGKNLKSYNPSTLRYAYQSPIYLAEQTRNAMFTVSELSVRFNPKNDNILWTALSANKLAMFTPENFKQITKTIGSYTFKMNVTEVKTIDDIKKALGLWVVK